MRKLPYAPLSHKVKLGKWSRNHVFVISGPGALTRAKILHRSGRCQPAIAYSGDRPPDSYQWPVCGLDVTVKDTGTQEETLEQLAHQLLKAGANLVALVHGPSCAVTVYRRDRAG